MDDPGRFEREIGELRDRQAIADCLAAYAQAIDRRDDALLVSLFKPGERLHYGVFDGSIEQLLAHRSAATGLVATHHHVGNIRIRLDQGGSARSIAYLNVVHRAQRGEALVDEMIRARYLDRLVKLQGTWRFAERTLVYDWSRTTPADPVPWWETMPGAQVRTGRADPTDLAHGFLD